MHAKAMLIDDDLLYIGSGNFDYRTLVQDIENGFLLTGQMARDLQKLYAEYFLDLKNVRPVTDKLGVGLISKFLNPVIERWSFLPPVAAPPTGKEPQQQQQ